MLDGVCVYVHGTRVAITKNGNEPQSTARKAKKKISEIIARMPTFGILRLTIFFPHRSVSEMCPLSTYDLTLFYFAKIFYS